MTNTFTPSDLDAMIAAMRAIPKSNIARLQSSAFVERGDVYRMAPQPALTGDHRPLVVINEKDLEELRAKWGDDAVRDGLPRPSVAVIDQHIADAVESRFQAVEASKTPLDSREFIGPIFPSRPFGVDTGGS